MQLMKRAIGALAAGLVLVPSGAVVARSATAAVSTPAIAWRQCAEEQARYECGTLALPIDRSNPGGPTFELAVNRHKATDPAHRIGVLFVNPGGPGGSGVQFAEDAAQYFSPQIIQRFDIIGFDPRGVGDSNPVVCATDLRDRQRGAIYPRTAAEFAGLVTIEKRLREDCRRRTGPLFDHMSSADVAEDMDALRSALGEPKISYYGLSYGTLFGQMYAERHGDRIRAMVLDSNLDHSLDARSFLASSARSVEDSFQEWVNWNQRTASSPLHGQNVVKIWDDLMAKADRGELIEHGDDGDHKLTSAKLTEDASGVGYGPDWLSFSERVAALHTGATVPPDGDDDAPGETVAEPLAASLCSDFNFTIRDFKQYRSLASAERRNAPLVRGSYSGHAAITACLASPPAGNPQHTPKIKTPGKILLLNSAHDPATPHQWAAAIHRQTIASTVLLTYDGWGHGAYPYATCTRSTTDNYLTALKLPTDNAHCPAQDPTNASKSSQRTVRASDRS